MKVEIIKNKIEKEIKLRIKKHFFDSYLMQNINYNCSDNQPKGLICY